jgi:fermentation-respiration switch protein FrsA (DUF1100 family)
VTDWTNPSSACMGYVLSVIWLFTMLISKIHSPLLIVNGDHDQVVPPSHGARLYSLANHPKEFHSLSNRGHNDAFDQFALVSTDWIARACNPK